MHHIILLGHRGALGSAVLRGLQAQQSATEKVTCIDSRRLYGALADPDSALPVELRELAQQGPVSVVCAVGIIDPRAPVEALRTVNALAPARIYDRLDALREELHNPWPMRFLSFGSVLEENQEMTRSNPYLRSKHELCALRAERISQGEVAWQHLRLHTLYGAERPHPFMFLGQMKAALQAGQVFRMSSGEQRREYHHVDDMAQNLLAYWREGSASSEQLEINSGEAVRLRDLAETVFAHFHASELLQIGVLEPQPAEVYENPYERSEKLRFYRAPIAGVIDWLESQSIDVRQS